MSNTGIPLQSAQNPPPDEDMLALLGLHPAQLEVAQRLHSGDLHPQQVMDAVTPKTPAPATPATPLTPPSPVPLIASPRSAPGLPPIAQPSKTELDQNELARLQQTGSGLEQFQHRHPILGTAARIGAGIGSAMFPSIAAAIPGTDIHHAMLERRQEGRVAEDLGEQQKQAQTAEEQAKAGLETAQAAQAGQVKPKEETWKEFPQFTDTDGTALKIEQNSGTIVRATDGKPPTGMKAAKPAGTKTNDIVRIVNGVPHEIKVNEETGEDIKDMGQTKLPGETPEQKRSAQESAQVERESRQSIRKAEGEYRGTEKSISQLKGAIDSASDGNGLLTSFVPTMEVLGINVANGVHRISPQEAQAAQLPGGWVERFNAWFDKSTTGKISPQLKTEGKQLADLLLKTSYQKYKSTYDDESGIVSGYGVKDFEKRVPQIKEPAGDQAGNAPKVGTVENGYRFKGGDPSKQENWEQVK